jgi:hypothetical protein
VGLISKPLFGAIGDRFHIQKKLFVGFQFVIIIAFLSILFIPPIPAKSELHCHSGVTLLKFCPPNLDTIDNCTIHRVQNESNSDFFGSKMKCEKNEAWKGICKYWEVPGLCESSDKRVEIYSKVAHNKIEFIDSCFDITFYNATINDHNTSLYCPTTSPKVEMKCDVIFEDETANELFAGSTDTQTKSTYQFWTFFMMLIISWAGMAVVVSIGDAICFEMLGDKPQRFG